MRVPILLSLMLLVHSAFAAAEDVAQSTSTAAAPSTVCENATDSNANASDTAGVGVGIVLDEHILTDADSDHDYNGGGEITISGQHAGFVGRALDRALGFIDRNICPHAGGTSSAWNSVHAFAAGLLIFTPKDLSPSTVVQGDRPYASLFFLSAGRLYTSKDAGVAYASSLTFGMLGLAAAGTVQRALHSVTGSTEPGGWPHQISAGGEPTIRYKAARQSLLLRSEQSDIKWTLAGSLGTVTEASIALSTRWGRIASPWYTFAPEETMYVQETQPLPQPLEPHSPAEIFVFAGARVKARAYNAFLQGQFRHSDLRYQAGDLNQVLGEFWAGAALRTSSGWSVQYLARWQSPEMRHGAGSRNIVWGSVQIAKSFR